MSLDPDRYGEITLSGETVDMVFERRFAKPIQKVWAAITTPERIADWFGGTEVQLEPRLGGAYRLRFAPDQPFTEGEITAWDPPRLFEHTWPDEGATPARVRYELEPDGDGCRLRFSNRGVPKGYVGALAGWHIFLDAIPDAVEGRAMVWSMDAERALMAEYEARIPWLKALTSPAS